MAKQAGTFVLITVITFACFLLVDLVLGATVMNKAAQSARWLEAEQAYRVSDPVYHHKLKPSSDINPAFWGGRAYRVCTNTHGFKSPCDAHEPASQSYDLAFLGDSFTEGVGMSYEDSFVGLFAAERPALNIANLAVASYSPKIYLAKMRALLAEGFRFDHVVVFVDISDIQDDALAYVVENDRVVSSELLRQETESTNQRAPLFSRAGIMERLPFSAMGYRLLKGLATGEKPYADQFEMDRSAWTYDADNPAYGTDGVDAAVAVSLAQMTELAALLKAQGIALSVGVYPWPGQLKHDIKDSRQVQLWQNFCQSHCASFINAFPDFATARDELGLHGAYEANFILGDVHYNAAGNALVARAISRDLTLK